MDDVAPYMVDDVEDIGDVVDVVQKATGAPDAADDEELPDSATRAATAKLSADQVDVLDRLLDGFASRRRLLEWQQDLVIQSLGQLDDAWYTEVATDANLVAALLGCAWGPCDGFDHVTATEVRRSLLANDVLPGFHAAHQSLRWTAVERIDYLDADATKPDDVVDPESQRFPAMRPALAELDEWQEWALARLLDGFEDAEALLLWMQRVIAATHAEIPVAVVKRPYFEQPLREYLCSPSNRRAEFVREWWAATYLLPAFNAASASLAKRAGEVRTGREAPDQSPLAY